MRVLILVVACLLPVLAGANSVQETVSAEVKRAIKNACNRINVTRNTREVTPQGILKEEVARFYGVDETAPQIEKMTEEFWNKYHNHFICDVGEVVPGHGRTRLHITKMALQYRLFDSFFDEFLVKEDSEYEYNINSVQRVDGKPETVIDYVDFILSNRSLHKYYNIKQIKFFKELLIEEYNAKTAKQLLEETP